MISLIFRDINSTLITFDHFIIIRAKTVFRFFRNSCRGWCACAATSKPQQQGGSSYAGSQKLGVRECYSRNKKDTKCLVYYCCLTKKWTEEVVMVEVGGDSPTPPGSKKRRRKATPLRPPSRTAPTAAHRRAPSPASPSTSPAAGANARITAACDARSNTGRWAGTRSGA